MHSPCWVAQRNGIDMTGMVQRKSKFQSLRDISITMVATSMTSLVALRVRTAFSQLSGMLECDSNCCCSFCNKYAILWLKCLCCDVCDCYYNAFTLFIQQHEWHLVCKSYHSSNIQRYLEDLWLIETDHLIQENLENGSVCACMCVCVVSFILLELCCLIYTLLCL